MTDMAAVFTEWKARYDADPNLFDSCEVFQAAPPKDYGDAAARYFLWLAQEMAQDETSSTGA